MADTENSFGSTAAHIGIDMIFRQVYKVTEKLGKGAFGSVWKAEHLDSGEDAAVKIIDRRCVVRFYFQKKTHKMNKIRS